MENNKEKEQLESFLKWKSLHEFVLRKKNQLKNTENKRSKEILKDIINATKETMDNL